MTSVADILGAQAVLTRALHWFDDQSSLAKGLMFLGVLALTCITVMTPLVLPACLRRRRRAREMQEVAAALGMRFRRGAYPLDPERFPHLRGNRIRPAIRPYHTAAGTAKLGGRPAEVLLGDLTSGDEEGPESARHRSFVLAQMPLAVTPELVVQRREAGRDLGVIGMESVALESDEFNRLFSVRASSRRFAFDLLDPRVMEFLLEESPGWISINDGWMMIGGHDEAGAWKREGFLWALQWASRFFDRLPGHLLAELGRPEHLGTAQGRARTRASSPGRVANG